MEQAQADQKVVRRHPRDPKYPVINSRPSFDEIYSNFSFGDYARWAALGVGSAFPVGYAIGSSVRGAKTPTMIVSGFLGTIGGFLISYQQSAGRLGGYFPNEADVARHSLKSKAA